MVPKTQEVKGARFAATPFLGLAKSTKRVFSGSKARGAHEKWQTIWLKAEMASTLGDGLHAPVCPLW